MLCYRLLAVPLLLTGCTLIADVDRTEIETEAGSGLIEGGAGGSGGSGGAPMDGGVSGAGGGPVSDSGLDAAPMEGGAGTAPTEAGLDAGDAAG